jgi:hypothetical protein
MAQKRSVRAQNDIAMAAMLKTAQTVRSTGLPIGAARYLATKGIDAMSCAVVHIETAGYMLSLEYGILAFIVTPENWILEVELELDESLKDVLQVVAFRDVTEAQNLSKHNPGTGWGWGAMALEVQRRMSEI